MAIWMNTLMDLIFQLLRLIDLAFIDVLFALWGIGTSKLSKFDDQRIIDEIEYISKDAKTTTLMIADANFGILERDEKFAS